MIIGIILLVIVYAIYKSIDYNFSNRTSPNGYRTDWGAMNRDLANGKSQMEIKQKFNRGEYDIPNTIGQKFNKK